MRQFSPPHLAALAVLLVAAGGSVLAGRRFSRGGEAEWARWFSRVLAGIIFAAWAGEYLADVIEGTWSIQFTLPLQLTDVVSLTAIYALLTRRPWAVELVYYWAFTATLQAVITPDLAYDFPSVFYFTYFGYHVGAIVAAVWLVWGLGVELRPGAMWRTFAATLGWTCVAGVADVITGGNYMYLAWKPAHNSLLSAMGPWPWYIASGVLVGLVLLAIVHWVTVGLRRLAG